MDTENVVFNLFEGSCPNHPELTVKVISACGTLDFMIEHLDIVLESTTPVHIWSKRLDAIIGEIEFQCSYGCKFTIARNLFGDWNY